MAKAHRRKQHLGNKILFSAALSRYDDATRREVTLFLSEDGLWCWRNRLGLRLEKAASGRLAAGVMPCFLKHLQRVLEASDATEALSGGAERGFWFVRLYAAGSLLKFATGPVEGSGSALAPLDEMLVQKLGLPEGVFTAPR